ncbi:PD-(D/E)XK nuclease family protein [Carboxydothermus pertinax]|uniref:ATP-dependent helicase/deoxyribonuclease subunit B n=1 Tax=Carboxydothermus pertinax TaxID=870242 RepID=A0A1L8CVV1_9THEO|nr:PD-(D/E)XK nuclease family protein [Carboxydothermus pertinax]GAV23040.1 ATP-dependent helicase/deoxyribonuclease subunit B [Carboxydothermus pertinax]
MLTIVRGPVGSGKSRYCREEIVKALKDAPLGPMVLYIVPESATFENEYLLNTREDLPGSFRLQVLSFNRLALNVVREFKAFFKNSSEFVYQHTLKKILQENKGKLQILQKAADNPGFIEDLLKLFKEFRRYRVKPENLEKASSKIEDWMLQQKLKDVYLLYKLYLEKFGEEYTSEGLLEKFLEYAPKSKFLAGAKVFIDGFYTFTPLELEVIKTLLKTCAEVTVTLPTEYDPGIFNRLYTEALNLGIKVKELKLEKIERYRASELLHLVQNYYPLLPDPYSGSLENLSLIAAANPLEEMEKAARIIRYLAKFKGYKLSDILVLIPEDGYYISNIKTVFNEYGLPVYVDKGLAFDHHGLYFLLKGVFGEFNREAAIDCLKSGLLNLTADEVFALENYLLSRGLDGEKLVLKEAWEDPNSLYWESWEKGFEEIISFSQKLPLINTYREFSQSLKQLLLKIGVPRRISDEKGERFWQAFTNLLTEIEEVFGAESLNPTAFAEELLAYLAKLSLKTIPKGLDQVRAGSSKRYWTAEARAVIILGAVEGKFPSPPAAGLIFTEEERAKLKKVGLELSPLIRQRLKEDNFHVFLALTRARERVYVSYPRVSLTGESFTPALLVDWLKKAFPNLKSEEGSYGNETTLQALTGLLSREMVKVKKNGELPFIAQGAFNALLLSKPELITKIARAFATNPGKIKLNAGFKEFLPSKTLSVSRLETYYSCPLKYFLKYLIKAEEREIFTPEATDTGALLHGAVAEIIKTVREKGQKLSTLLAEDLKTLVYQAFTKAQQEYGEKFLASSRGRYFLNRLYLMLFKAVEALLYFEGFTKFTPFGEEIAFGEKERLKSPVFEVNGEKYTLAGKIDRIDVYENEGKTYLRIIDYKTGPISLSLDEVVGGINLQLLTYLLVASENKELFGENLVPAGAFYFRFQNPMLDEKAEGLTMEELREEVYKNFRLSGYALRDEESLKHLDSFYAQNNKFKTVNLRTYKDGRIDNALTPAELEALFTKIKELITEAIFKISTGEFSAIPYQLKDATGCRYCSYLEVCRLEEQEKQYRVIPRKKDPEVLLALSGGGAGDEKLDSRTKAGYHLQG